MKCFSRIPGPSFYINNRLRKSENDSVSKDLTLDEIYEPTSFGNFDRVKALFWIRAKVMRMEIHISKTCASEIVSKSQKEDEVGSSKGYKPIAYLAPIGVVSEGSKVHLDGSQSYFEYVNNTNNNSYNLPASATATRPIKAEDRVSFLWEQIEGPKVTLEGRNSATPSFIAPYVDLSRSSKKIHVILKFQLVIRERNGVLSEPHSELVVVKIIQRALVLQGGGALGAYELGVFKALCEDLSKKE